MFFCYVVKKKKRRRMQNQHECRRIPVGGIFPPTYSSPKRSTVVLGFNNGAMGEEPMRESCSPE